MNLNKLKDNAMLKINPDLIHEWDFEKNEGIDICKVSNGSSKKVWWINSKCKHSYETQISSKTKGVGCPYCANKKVLIGFNDLNTTNVNLAKLVTFEEDKYKYTQFSHKKINFTCPNCNYDCGQKKISDINIYGLSCVRCRDGISIPEKVMREILIQLNLNFTHDVKFKWSGNKRYDFYIESLNLIIEMHGKQHYNGGFETMGGKSLNEEQINDAYKLNLALNNNISNYISINASDSNITYLKENIENSELRKLLNLEFVNWVEVNINSQKSISMECLNLWNDGYEDLKSIACQLKIHTEMVRRYLKDWSSLGECNYNELDSRKLKVLQYSLNGELVNTWDSVNSILKQNDFMIRLELNKNLKNITKSAYSYIWKYEKSPTDYLEKRKSKEIVKLDNDLKLLNFYKSMSEACAMNDIKSMGSLTQCCKGQKRKYVKGFRWMYLEDYMKNILELECV